MKFPVRPLKSFEYLRSASLFYYHYMRNVLVVLVRLGNNVMGQPSEGASFL